MDAYNETLRRRAWFKQLSKKNVNTQPNNRLRYFRSHQTRSDLFASVTWVEIQLIDGYGTNVAEGILPTAQPGFVINNIERITDGDTRTGQYANMSTAGIIPVYVEIDLGEVKDIAAVKVWNYYGDTRKFFQKLEYSVDGVEWVTLFDSIADNSLAYFETSAGRSWRIKPVTWPEEGVRYIRDDSQGNTNENTRFFAEVEAIMADGYNVAMNKPVTIKDGYTVDTNTASKFIKTVTDGGIGNLVNTHDIYVRVVPCDGTEWAHVQVDLGQLYKPSKISCYHTYNWGRNENRIMVSSNGFVWHVIYDYRIDGLIDEPLNGEGITITTPWNENSNIPKGIRYVREHCRYSTKYGSRNMNEIQVMSATEGNVALGKLPTLEPNYTNTRSIGYWTDGSFDSTTWFDIMPENRDWAYVMIDLGKVYHDIQDVRVWHYNKEPIEYTYRVEVSADGKNWHQIWHSYRDGRYDEVDVAATGKIIPIPAGVQ